MCISNHTDKQGSHLCVHWALLSSLQQLLASAVTHPSPAVCLADAAVAQIRRLTTPRHVGQWQQRQRHAEGVRWRTADAAAFAHCSSGRTRCSTEHFRTRSRSRSQRVARVCIIGLFVCQ